MLSLLLGASNHTLIPASTGCRLEQWRHGESGLLPVQPVQMVVFILCVDRRGTTFEDAGHQSKSCRSGSDDNQVKEGVPGDMPHHVVLVRHGGRRGCLAERRGDAVSSKNHGMVATATSPIYTRPYLAVLKADQ